MEEKKPYGCLTVPGLYTAVLTMLVVVLVGLVRGGVLFSPGSLNAQAGAGLEGVTFHADLSTRCTACHALFWQKGTMADRCVGCHMDVAAQLLDPTTLHGDQLNKKPGIACRTCHPDHRGPDASLTDLAMADISHELFGYVLTAHQRQTDGSAFTCNTCHGNSYTTFDQTICSTCHQQIKPDFMQAHLQAYGATCLGCHDGIDTYGHNFNHAGVTFQLTGKHAQVACTGCHTGARSIADMKATSQDCSTCHAKDDPHNGQFSTGCGACHTTGGWLPATFDHSLSKFPLTGAHIGLACDQCHANGVFTGLSQDCSTCHAKDDPHKGQFGTGCGACHSTSGWLPATFDHSLSKFPLTGAHIGQACDKCHARGVFTGLSTACAACHADPAYHAGLFSGMTCNQCHSTSAWIPASFNLSHPGGCGDGGCIGHQGATCLDCHPARLSSSDCLKCHNSNTPGDGGGGDG